MISGDAPHVAGKGMKLTAEHIEPLVIGGALLGGGGGGDLAEGGRFARLALELGHPHLITVNELPSDATVVTVALVGAPSAPDRFVAPDDLPRAVLLLEEKWSQRIDALNGNENGGFASVNGWVQSAVLHLPLVDAPCNGRAHPTALMGAMGLHRRVGYISRQAAVGGDSSRHLEMTVSGSLEAASALVRQAAVQAGGLVAVARNPVDPRYLTSHGAPGAITMALRVGEAILQAVSKGREAAWEAAARAIRGRVIDVGRVIRVDLHTAGGFDQGTVTIQADGVYELTFWNEYMTLEQEHERLATFPDLIATLDDRGQPLTTAEISPGRMVAIVVTAQEHLILGDGMRDPELFRAAEQVIGKDLVAHAFA